MFQKATRKKVKLKIALTGPSGAGKTYSALKLAKGLGGKIALIDTENESASLYEDIVPFDVCAISAPYTVDKFIAAIDGASAAGYEVLIIDSLSHEWSGEGGILEKKTNIDSRGGNSFTNWKEPSADHNRMLNKILTAPIHVIATMRSKTEWVIEENDKGKKTPRKVGLAPQQRDGIEFEFTFVGDIAPDHSAKASKDRTGLLDGKIFKIDESTGALFQKWLDGAAEAVPAPAVPIYDARNKEHNQLLAAAAAKIGYNNDLKPVAKHMHGQPLAGIDDALKLAQAGFVQ